MVNTTIELFQNSLIKTTEILEEIERQLNIKNERRRSYHILKTVLHIIRDRLTGSEAADLGSQLPLLVKAIYFDGWSPSRKPIKINKQEFFRKVDYEIGLLPGYTSEQIVKVVIVSLHKYVSSGEIEDIKAIWPKDLKEIFD